MYQVDVYLRVRRAVMVDGMSIREASRVFGLHRDTVRKILAYSVPPGYRRQTPPRRPKLEPFTGVIDRILESDLSVPRKQRHPAKRIFQRLRDEYGFGGQYNMSLVRYRTNDYSVPVAYGHRDVLVRGYVDQVVISCGSGVIAKHPRSYRDDFVYDPIHYLPLLEQKAGALDQAAPLQGWDLPEEFAALRRLLESRMGPRGKREFVQVLRLLESFSLEEVHSVVRDSLRLGALSFDAVKHLVLCRLEGRPPRLDLELYPYLPWRRVNTTSAGDYMTLLSGRAA